MFLRNATWLRRAAIALLVLVVNLAGLWPLVSQQAARNLEIFRHFSEIMPVSEAIDMTLQAEFCGDAPTPEQAADQWLAQSSSDDGKLILLAPAHGLPSPVEISIKRAVNGPLPGRLAGLLEPPPPRA